MNDIMEMPSGKWINKINGEVIEVRDTFIEGDNMLLSTNKGMISMDEFSRYYIQVSDDIYDLKGTVIDNKPATLSDYSIENNTKLNNISTIIPEIKEIDEISSSENSSNNLSNNNSTNNYENLIKKIFDKKPIQPKVSLNFDCDNLPIDELKMLINVFDVPIINISDYFMDNFVDFNSIKEQMKIYIEDKIK